MTVQEFLKLSPAEAIELAIKDSKEVLESENNFTFTCFYYKSDSQTKSSEPCYVCFAGSILLQEKIIEGPHDYKSESVISGATEEESVLLVERMQFLDTIRKDRYYSSLNYIAYGCCKNFSDELRREYENLQLTFSSTPNLYNPHDAEHFFNVMQYRADFFRKNDIKFNDQD